MGTPTNPVTATTSEEDHLNLLYQIKRWAMLPRIPFSTSDYACLNGTVDVIHFIERWKELEGDLKSINDKITEASLKTRQSTDAIREEIFSGVAHRLLQVDEDDRYREFCELMSAAGRDFPSMNYEARFKREKAINSLTSLYVSFRAEDFERDFSEWAQQVSASEATDPETDIAKLRATEADLQLKLQEHWQTYGSLFRDGRTPTAWRDLRIDTTLPLEKQQAQRLQIARQLIGNFEGDWRSRVAFFDVPVDICGVAIETMAEPRRSAWLDAYTRWGLDKVKKRIRLCRPNVAADSGLPSPQRHAL